MIDTVIDKACTGCQMCGDSCPTGAISYKTNSEGFWYPTVNKNMCIRCNKCVEQCPVLTENKLPIMNESEVYAAWTMDDQVRFDSTSGGLFYELASYILRQNGVVFGARWESDWKSAEHIAVESLDQLPLIMGSKYIQSSASGVYRQVKKYVESGRKVLFCGTPCQNAALYQYLNKNYDNLYYIDFICNSINSPKAFEKYITELEYKYDSNVDLVHLKYKKDGWQSLASYVRFENGAESIEDKETDWWIKGFIEDNLYSRESCYDCHFRSMPRKVVDITIGDFWGISGQNEEDMRKGISAVLINSNKGSCLFDAIRGKLQIQKHDLREVISGNRRMVQNPVRTNKRDKFFNSLKYSFFSSSVKKAIGIEQNDRFQIGMVCLKANNYGNQIVNYALNQYLNDQGFKVIQIPCYKNLQYRTLFRSLTCNDEYVFEGENYESLNQLCDFFVVGGDQLFRDTVVEKSNFNMLLDFVMDYKYKFSYATSFGKEDFKLSSPDEMEKAKYLFKKINNISVREETGITLLRNLFDVDGRMVADPTFICDIEHYKKLARLGENKKDKERYIGAYILDGDLEKYRIIDEVSQISEISTKNVIKDAYTSIENNIESIPSLEEWLAMIFGAEYVITDSFHGVCLSIIFQKQFLVVYKNNTRGATRIANILKLFHLENRLVTEITRKSIEQIMKNSIDYNDVNDQLDKLRNDSKVWLNQELRNGATWRKIFSEVDMLNIKLLEMQSKLNNQDLLIKKLEGKLFFDEMQKQCLRNKVVCFGIGKCFERMKDKLVEYVDIQFVADNNPEKWDTIVYDSFYCINPEKLKDVKDANILITVDSNVIATIIAEQLERMGITRYKSILDWSGYFKQV